MTLDAAASNKTNEVSIATSAIYQQIVESDTTLDDALNHLNEEIIY